MAKGYNVAVVGATGAVGVEMIETLAKRAFPVKSLRLFASERSVGKKLKFKGADITVELLKAGVFQGIDFALLARARRGRRSLRMARRNRERW